MSRTKAHRSIGSACVFLAVFGLLFLATSPKNLIFPRKIISSRKTSSKRKASEVFQKITDRCELPELRVPQERIVASFLASYPGSDTSLQWELVEAITGIVTTDDTFANGHHNVAAIRTHYPCPSGRVFLGAEEIVKAMIVIRHPMETLAAYHDMIYASEGNLKADPPRRAPLNQWIEWRDSSFARELETWKKHLTYWMDRYGAMNRVVIPYEKLMSRKYGPNVVIEMAEFLQRGNSGVATADPVDLPCIWQKVLKKGRSSDSRETKKLRRRLQEQHEFSMQTQQEHQLTNVHQRGEGHAEMTRQQQPERSSVQQGSSRSMISQQQLLMLPPDQTTATQMMKSQRDDASQETELLGSLGMNRVPTQMDQRFLDNDAGDQNNMPIDVPIEIAGRGQAILENKHVSYNEDLTETNENNVNLLNDEVNVPSELAARQSIETDFEVDDDNRPYTEHQRKEVVIVLTQLLERYRDDSDLAPVLVEYIDLVT